MLTDNIKFKERTCIYNNEKHGHKLGKQISIYVVTTRNCNTNCKFCEFHCGKSDIDTHKLKLIIECLVSEGVNIPTIHFTGGEPTLELDKIIDICSSIKSIDSCISTSVNTNGTRLNELVNIKNLDNIALSRHAISDKDNFDIFRSKLVPTYEQIDAFRDKRKIHLSCNLINGYIDSADKVRQYLEMAASLDINDVGFVSLMGINKYSKDKYIDFEALGIEDSICNSICRKTRQYRNVDKSNEVVCRCENYLYRASNLKLVSMYHRHAIRNSEISDYLVYEDNHLKQGFNGKIII